jgi:thiol-disulfide isomerase/thioredoxin
MIVKKYLSLFRIAVLFLGVMSVKAGTNLVGTLAPAPVFVTLSGQYQVFSKLYYQGSERLNEPRTTVVLRFTSLYCLPCHKEMPAFLDVVRPVAEEAKKKGIPFRFFLVSMDPLSVKEDLRKFMLEKEILIDSQLLLDPYKKAAEKFGVVSIPRTFVISANGRVTADISGVADDYSDLLKAGIDEALKEEKSK